MTAMVRNLAPVQFQRTRVFGFTCRCPREACTKAVSRKSDSIPNKRWLGYIGSSFQYICDRWSRSEILVAVTGRSNRFKTTVFHLRKIIYYAYIVHGNQTPSLQQFMILLNRIQKEIVCVQGFYCTTEHEQNCPVQFITLISNLLLNMFLSSIPGWSQLFVLHENEFYCSLRDYYIVQRTDMQIL